MKSFEEYLAESQGISGKQLAKNMLDLYYSDNSQAPFDKYANSFVRYFNVLPAKLKKIVEPYIGKCGEPEIVRDGKKEFKPKESKTWDVTTCPVKSITLTTLKEPKFQLKVELTLYPMKSDVFTNILIELKCLADPADEAAQKKAQRVLLRSEKIFAALRHDVIDTVRANSDWIKGMKPRYHGSTAATVAKGYTRKGQLLIKFDGGWFLPRVQGAGNVDEKVLNLWQQ